jgi:4-diphosphocytidyl-2C-methyl-D-erythritol kinase
VTLVLLGVHCSTPAVYRAWDELPEHPPRPDLSEILSQVNEPEKLMGVLFNDLEEPALGLQPKLAKVFGKVAELSNGPVRMTGSGSALYRLFASESAAVGFARHITDNLGVRTATAQVREAAAD